MPSNWIPVWNVNTLDFLDFVALVHNFSRNAKHMVEHQFDPVRLTSHVFAPVLRIGESPSIYPFLKNNGHEAPKGPIAIIFQEWTDTRTFSYLKYTLIYNYV